MKVFLNDKPVTLDEGATLRQALDSQGVDSTGVAAALNDKVVPRELLDTTRLADGDSVIIIKPFYGG